MANIQLETLIPGKRFVLLYPGPAGKKYLRVLDVSGGKVALFAPVEAAPIASHLSAFGGRYAYVSVLPNNRGTGVIGTWEGRILTSMTFPTRQTQARGHVGPRFSDP